MYTLKINFEEKGQQPVTFENLEPNQTLLEICLKNDIELHHNCGGVCSCTTCHLYIEKGMEFMDAMERRENDYLRRIMDRRPVSRQGCQSLLLAGEGKLEILVPDQTLLPDEYYGEEA